MRRPTIRASYLAEDGSWPSKDCYSVEEAREFTQGAQAYCHALLLVVTREAILEQLRKDGDASDSGVPEKDQGYAD